jgi:hypothetical protein
MKKILLITAISLFLTNCTTSRTQVGAVLGGATTTGSCVSMGIDNPYAIGACAMMGAFVGADIMYESDFDVHNAVFVDHLNTGPKYIFLYKLVQF